MRLRHLRHLPVLLAALLLAASGRSWAAEGPVAADPQDTLSAKWWLRRASREAAQIEPPALREKALGWIRNAQYGDFDGFRETQRRLNSASGSSK